MEQKVKKKHHYFLSLLLFLAAFAGITYYACSFPVTMELLDNEINKIILKTNDESDFSFFSDFSEFANDIVNEAIYIAEIIKNNIDGIFGEIKPITGFIFTSAGNFPLDNINITSEYGERINPITDNEEIHNGIDIASPEGADIYSLWPGTVSETGYDNIYGNYIIIEHSEDFFTKYCHLSKISVNLNDFINFGEIIGKTGSTGYSTGSHLHLEVVIDGINIDPMECFDL